MSTDFVHGLNNLPAPQPSVVTVGTFDGIHLGHQAIFRRVRQVADEYGLRPILVTFHPHPRELVSPHDKPMLLTSLTEKELFVPCYFEGTVLVMPFDRQLMNLGPDEFVRNVLLDKIGLKKLVVGYNHALGKNRAGTIDELTRLSSKYDFDVEVVEPIIHDGAKVSSSRIRRAMTLGRYSQARELLGHEYAIAGMVERGIGLGRQLGYPTANIRYGERKLLPPEGVYACWTEIGDEKKSGMMFIGQNHFNPVARVSVEANLFDFDRDIYDRELVVYPTEFVRRNRLFKERDALIEQLKQDKIQVLEILRRGEKTECH